MSDIFIFFRSCMRSQLELMFQVNKASVLLLVMPATNLMLRVRDYLVQFVLSIKTYLRSTMSQQCLKHLMLLHVHVLTTNFGVSYLLQLASYYTIGRSITAPILVLVRVAKYKEVISHI